MKVIFLDIDGVLNSQHDYIKNHKRHPEKCRTGKTINFRLVKNLRTIVSATGAKIVLSSSQRYGDISYFKKILYDNDIEIYDRTPRTGMERGIDIQEWLNHHLDVTHIVILDDDSDMCHLEEYLIKTRMQSCVKIRDKWVKVRLPFAWYFIEGLTKRKAEQAIAMLRYKPFVNKMLDQVKNNTRKQF